MLFEEPKVQALLKRIVHRMGAGSSWADDLMQEGLIHLWLVETQRPHQTLSWYLQSCQFHLLGYMAVGRSVDAPKRRRRLLSFAHSVESNGWLVRWEIQNAVWPAGDTYDLLAVLRKWLQPAERDILVHLADGLGAREIGRKLGISHQAVVKRRRKIATLAVRLGINPLPKPRKANGSELHGFPAADKKLRLPGPGRTPSLIAAGAPRFYVAAQQINGTGCQ